MASFRCYNNSDVIATLITTNFHLYLIHLWWQLFQMFVYGDVVYAQTWQVLTLKNCMEPFSYASTAYLFASALVSVRLFCKNLGNLQKCFGQMVYRLPWQKIARTPMCSMNWEWTQVFCRNNFLRGNNHIAGPKSPKYMFTERIAISLTYSSFGFKLGVSPTHNSE